MLLSKKNILLISPEAWGKNFLSKHNYAIELAKKGNTVYFLNPPTNRFFFWKERNNLFIFDYKISYRGLSKMPSFLSAWLIKKEIAKLEKKANTTFDIIWNFDSSRFFNLKLLYSKLKISHIVDYSEDKNKELLSATADICFSISNFILKRQKQFNTNAFIINHGYAYLENTSSIEIPFSNNPIKVGYVGNLLIKYLDWELVYTLAKENPNTTFYFAGPYTKSNLNNTGKKPLFLLKTMNLTNTFFIGAIYSNKIPEFLAQMDILLLAYITYKGGEIKQLSNSHKLTEYLASGKVVISSWVDDFKDKKNLLEMVQSQTEYLVKFKTVLNNIKQYNTKELAAKRINFAMKNTYIKQIERIEKLLE